MYGKSEIWLPAIGLFILWLPLPVRAESVCYDSLDCPEGQICDPVEHECVFICTVVGDCAQHEDCIDGFCRGAETSEEDTGCGCGRMATISSPSCISKTECYCKLVSEECDILVSAAVISRESYLVAIEILEPPHHDPRGYLQGASALNHLVCREAELKAGDRGLARLSLNRPCDQAVTQIELMAMVTETDGVYPCTSDSGFEGLSKEELLSAVLVGDDENIHSCTERVHALGLEEGRCGLDEGCCYQNVASLSNSLVFLLVAGVVLARRRSIAR